MLPLDSIVNKTRAKVDIHSRMWNRLITATGQPRLTGDDDEEASSSTDDVVPGTKEAAVSEESGQEKLGAHSPETAGLSEGSLPDVPGAP